MQGEGLHRPQEELPLSFTPRHKSCFMFQCCTEGELWWLRCGSEALPPPPWVHFSHWPSGMDERLCLPPNFGVGWFTGTGLFVFCQYYSSVSLVDCCVCFYSLLLMATLSTAKLAIAGGQKPVGSPVAHGATKDWSG